MNKEDKGKSNHAHFFFNFLFYSSFCIILVTQLILCLHQIASTWQIGWHGRKGAEARIASLNTITHKIAWPAPYHIDESKPSPSQLIIEAPPGMHLINSLAVSIGGASEIVIRIPSALFSFFAVLMLILLLFKHCNRFIAIVAGAVYVLLPINFVFCNMPEKQSACIFFSLMMIDGYLSWKKKNVNLHIIEFSIGIICATLIDWPGYTVALCLAVSSLYDGLKPAKNGMYSFNRYLIFSLIILFFLSISFKGTINAIQNAKNTQHILLPVTGGFFNGNIISIIKELNGNFIKSMFPAPLKVGALLWLIITLLKHASRRWDEINIIPLAFLISGMLELIIFPKFATTYPYWHWQFVPFTSVACSLLIYQFSELLSDVFFKLQSTHKQTIKSIILSLLTLFIVLPTLKSTLKISIRLKIKGGNISQIAPDQIDIHNRKMLFAKFIFSKTLPGDEIFIHQSFQHGIEFDSYLYGRKILNVSTKQISNLTLNKMEKRQRIIIGDYANIKKEEADEINKIINEHPAIYVDSFFVFYPDKTISSTIHYTIEKRKSGLIWKYFYSPYPQPIFMKRKMPGGQETDSITKDRLPWQFEEMPKKGPTRSIRSSRANKNSITQDS